uniref:Uncharacterized protein n=2 Tax=Meloidogyne TaxID=189290 RepID=A0A6V7UME4_MELEN|nr:unnamed protein product [Meloidogyne enterolobii]CAD2174855.1 unnamed protein product [Meloidogyne enterolobii]CAD2181081.1 unnamed protein product [Meloidogyne enterolobii]
MDKVPTTINENNLILKRVIIFVTVLLTVIAVVLVVLSLSLGPKIDQLVTDSLETRLDPKELLSPKIN